MEEKNTKLRKKPTRLEDMTKEQIRQAILKKRECNAKAQNIVESLLEKAITEEYFLKCLSDINQCHFEDVVEERAIIKLCGYPLCSKSISDKDIPKQQYRISLKTNKVYDITARKSFCSNSCYKSAMHIKKQMLTSPLWFREYEEVPKFNVLPLDSCGSMGQEIDVSLIDRIQIKPEKMQTFTSINDFTQAGLQELGENNLIKNDTDLEESFNKCLQITAKSEAQIEKPSTNAYLNESNIKSHAPDKATLSVTETKEEIKDTKIQTKKQPSNPLNIVGDIIERPEKKIDPILIDKPVNITSDKYSKTLKKTLQKKQPSLAVITIEVERCLAEWFTLDTMLFLLGEEKVKELVTDKGECIKEYLNNYSKSIFYSSNSYDQYQALCRKLNMLELEDRRYDANTLQRETKPLPDYSILQEESKKIQLKVKAFFSGETEIEEPVACVTENKPNTDEENLTQLPLVDKNSQNALRRKIVCQHLNKVLPDLLRSLGLLTLAVSSDVKLLVNTFQLKANNIMFKPIQWTLIAIVFIKLLSLRDRRLEHLLQQPTAYQHMQLLLLSYKQDGGYLDRLISWLTDIDRLLDVNDTQLTIE